MGFEAISDRLVQCLSPFSCPKRSMQSLLDVGPFLTEKDFEFFSNTDYNIEAKVNRLSLVFALLGCTNTTAIVLLQQSFRVTAARLEWPCAKCQELPEGAPQDAAGKQPPLDHLLHTGRPARGIARSSSN